MRPPNRQPPLPPTVPTTQKPPNPSRPRRPTRYLIARGPRHFSIILFSGGVSPDDS